jgi:hypothetical protein
MKTLTLLIVLVCSLGLSGCQSAQPSADGKGLDDRHAYYVYFDGAGNASDSDGRPVTPALIDDLLKSGTLNLNTSVLINLPREDLRADAGEGGKKVDALQRKLTALGFKNVVTIVSR